MHKKLNMNTCLRISQILYLPLNAFWNFNSEYVFFFLKMVYWKIKSKDEVLIDQVCCSNTLLELDLVFLKLAHILKIPRINDLIKIFAIWYGVHEWWNFISFYSMRHVQKISFSRLTTSLLICRSNRM